MSTQTEQPRVRAMVLTIAGLMALIIAIAVANMTGFADPELTKRGAGAMFGVILAAAGNALPKLVRPLSERRDPAVALAVERFTARAFVAAGFAVIAACLLAPIAYALPMASVVGLGTFGAVAAAWALRAPNEPLPHPASPQGALLQIFHALLWVFAIFAADWIWGDSVAQWLAIAFTLAMGLLYSALIAAAKTNGSAPGQ